MEHLEDAIAATQFRLHKLQVLKADKDNLERRIRGHFQPIRSSQGTFRGYSVMFANMISSTCCRSKPSCSSPAPSASTHTVSTRVSIEHAVYVLLQRNQYRPDVVTRDSETKTQLKGQVKDLTIAIALHAKANKELRHNLSCARDQIWGLRFQHEAVEWINKEEVILPTRKRSSPADASSQRLFKKSSLQRSLHQSAVC
jgi:hypothetical protein